MPVHTCIVRPPPQQDRRQREMNKPLKENEIRRLLSRAWGRRRRQAYLSDVRNARHLNLNRELNDDEARGDRLKYFFAILVFGAFFYIVYSRSGLG